MDQGEYFIVDYTVPRNYSLLMLISTTEIEIIQHKLIHHRVNVNCIR